MSELTTWNNNPGGEVVDYRTRAVRALTEWAQAADAAFNIAQKLVQSSFVPVQFKGKPVEAASAILAGTEVGLQPMAALRSFDVIQGVAAPRAITLRAIVQSHGHEIVLVESNNNRCRMKGKRRNSNEWQTVTWTLDRAKDLGLTGKENWKKQPAAMLVARATSEIARLIGSDAILGLGYSAEEVADGHNETIDLEVEPVEPSPRVKVARRQPAPEKPEAEPEAEPEPTPEPEPEPEPAPDDDDEPVKELKATQPQLKKLYTMMGKAGLGDRDLALKTISGLIGREISSSSELTRNEIQEVFRELEALEEGVTSE